MFVMVCGAVSAGWLFSRFIARVSYRHPLPALAANFAIGLNLLGLSYLALGSIGLLKAVASWTLPVAAILAACSSALLNRSRIAFPDDVKTLLRGHRLFFVLATLFFLVALGSALCYPFGWDELTYHVEIPMRWSRIGSLKVFPDNPYSGFPSLVEILFANGIAMGGVLFPRLLNLSVCLFLLFSFWLLLRRYANRFFALVGTAVLAVSPLFLALARETYVESFIALDFTAALLAIRYIRSKGTRVGLDVPRIISVGILAGGAAAVKLSGVIIPVVVVGIWFLDSMTSRKALLQREGDACVPEADDALFDKRDSTCPALRVKSVLPVFIILTLVVGLFAAPFYLRPWIQTGNPFHPYFAEWFTHDPAALLVSRQHHLLAERFGTHGLTGFLAAPVTLAFRGDLYDAIVVGWQLPFCLALFLAVWARRRIIGDAGTARCLWMPAAFSAYLLFWYLTAQQSRFVLPLLILAILAGFRAMRWLPGRLRCSGLILLCAVAAISVDIPVAKHYYYGWKRHFLLRLTNEGYLKKALRDDGYIDAMKALALKTPVSARIAMVFERRGLYCPRPHIIATPCFQGALFTPLPLSPELLLKKSRLSKIDFLLFGGSPANPDFTKDDARGAAEFAAALAKLAAKGEIKLVWAEKGYNLFKLGE